MRILVVSRSWPSTERSGVSLAAAAHVEMMVGQGHEVFIIGAFPQVQHENLSVKRRFYVAAYGSGALYSPARVNRMSLISAIAEVRPDLVVVEAWQTGLGDAAIEVSFARGLPVLMISHGVSVHSFSSAWIDRLRSFAWLPYRLGYFPGLVRRLCAITTLDEHSRSPRFYDRDLARRIGIPVFPLANFPVNWTIENIPFQDRKRQLLLIGYFSPVKNQLSALELLQKLPEDIMLHFIGPRSGKYYLQCVRYASELNIRSRVMFSEDQEIDIAGEIASSIAVLSTSITEALPICLLEAMACGTPFIATPVGAVPSLRGGIIRQDVLCQAEAVISLVNDSDLWMRLSSEGMATHNARYSRAKISEQLAAAVEGTFQAHCNKAIS